MSFVSRRRKKRFGNLGLRLSLDQLTKWAISRGRANWIEKEQENAEQINAPIVTILVVSDTVTWNNALADLKKQAKLIRESFANTLKLRFLFEATSTDEAKAAENAGFDGIVAKGYEASGVVGEQTAFVLMQECLAAVNIPVYVWGGIGLHTAAACCAAGASGVVLDSQLWLSHESPLPLLMKNKFEQSDGTESQVLSLSHLKEADKIGKDVYLRIMSRPGFDIGEQILARTKNVQEIYERVATYNKKNSASQWILPVGQDIAFAKILANIYSSTASILQAVRKSVREHIALARDLKPLAENSAMAHSHGTKYPIVQGAMTRVSDKAEFALSVANGGGLPFLALALMRGKEAEKLLQETKEMLGNLPWGVGILGFVPLELRQEQMAVLEKYKPPYVLIAGGRPDQAKKLEELGINTYLHVPSPLLLDSFMEMGCRRFIFEGRECGGHVGPRSSFVLWETMIDHLLRNIRPRQDASAYHVLFAGGIHDARSAAAIAAMAAPLAARGLKIGVLMGTAYLFTQEAVQSGAIVKRFQEEAINCQNTVLLETGPGHAIRCLNSPYKRFLIIAVKLLLRQGRTKRKYAKN